MPVLRDRAAPGRVTGGRERRVGARGSVPHLVWDQRRRERIERLSRTAVAFEDPPGVHGTGQPSGDSFPANGVMLFNPSSKGFFYGETCVLPASEHTVCTLLLNDALRRALL
jgi:hypothetical protein